MTQWPRVDPAFIAQNGGIQVLLLDAQQQIGQYDRAFAQNMQAAQQATAYPVQPALCSSAGNSVLSAALAAAGCAQDGKRAMQEVLRSLQCWARQPGVGGGVGGGAGTPGAMGLSNQPSVGVQTDNKQCVLPSQFLMHVGDPRLPAAQAKAKAEWDTYFACVQRGQARQDVLASDPALATTAIQGFSDSLFGPREGNPRRSTSPAPDPATAAAYEADARDFANRAADLVARVTDGLKDATTRPADTVSGNSVSDFDFSGLSRRANVNGGALLGAVPGGSVPSSGVIQPRLP